MDANAIRRLLDDAFPSYKNLSAKTIGNIRRNAYNIINSANFGQDEDPMTLLNYTSERMVAADEVAATDPEAMRLNFGKILAEVMRNSECTWKALGYLKKLKSQISGFDYAVRYDDSHHPCGIMWLFPEQRQFLIRFGSILFLDMRKAAVNKLNYPYCAITMMDQSHALHQLLEPNRLSARNLLKIINGSWNPLATSSQDSN